MQDLSWGEHFLCHCLGLYFKNGPWNRAGLTGKVVFLRVPRNSSICSNSVPLAWAGSCTSIWTTVSVCPETRGGLWVDAIALSCCRDATLLHPPFCCLFQPAQVGALPWVICASAPQKLQLYLGTLSALQLHLQVQRAFIFPPTGSEHHSDPAAGSWVLCCPWGSGWWELSF